MKDIFKDDDTFLARWLNDELSPEELMEFEKSEDYESYKLIAEKTSNLGTDAWNKEKVWNSIREKGEMDHSAVPAQKVFSLGKWVRYGAAACIIALVGYLALFRGDNLEIHQTLAAQSQTVNLPDGSKVYLNADSKLSYNAKSFSDDRELNLEGEAFFEVVKGSKFKVETQNGDVRVLGTSFNVRNRGQRLDVQCFTGSVGVSFNDFKNEEVLMPGDNLISAHKKLINRFTVDNDLTRPEWRDGRTKFVDVGFDEVINEIERQFDIEIKSDVSIDISEKYNGGFNHSDLESALKIVFSSINYDYRIEGKTVFLFEKQ